MSSAADDRLIIGARSHRRAVRGRVKSRELVSEARHDANSRIEIARAEARAAIADRDAMRAAIPFLEDFCGCWLGVGFWRRVWNAARYVFCGRL